MLYLTPMSRAKAVPTIKETTTDEEDEMEALLNTPSGQFEAMVNTGRDKEKNGN